MKINDAKRSIYCRGEYGPVFGGGRDILISKNANDEMSNSFSYLGSTYQHSKYEYNSEEIMSFLAGSFQFQLDEIEVYLKE